MAELEQVLRVVSVLLVLSGSACAGHARGQSGPAQSRVDAQSEQGSDASEQAGASASECPGQQPSAFSERSPDELFLDAEGAIVRAFITADFRVQVEQPEQLELELHRPDGSVHRQSFMHHSVEMMCPGCDPVPGGPPDQCANVCSLRPVGPARPEIPPEVMNQYGKYTVVLRRPSTGAQKVVSFTVGSDLPYDQDPVCTEAPERVGAYVRSECGAGILPVDHKTTFGATRVTYVRGSCSVNVLLRIAKVGGITDHGTPQLFHETNLGRGRAEGELRISERNGRTLAAWLGSRLVVVDAPKLGPDERELIEGLLAVFPATP